jgi:hypothetical protein
MTIFRNIYIVIKIYKIMITHLPVDSDICQYQKKANYNLRVYFRKDNFEYGFDLHWLHFQEKLNSSAVDPEWLVFEVLQ